VKVKKIPQQLIPLAFLLALAVAALVIMRLVLLPETFGEYGHYRALAVDDVAALDIAYAGHQACAECHDDVYELKQQSNHRGVACEACHGPAAAHIEAPDEYAPEVPRNREHCTLCHGYNPTRPTGFPQIIPELHNPRQPCMTCHQPHHPELPHAPEECAACHRQIVNEKAVSHHASLSCTTCHDLPAEHLVDPVMVRALKPSTREKCGQCHASNADSAPEIPRIELATHGEGYLCWECHYPHQPEANR
jgi:hypothetical protein